jgi:hypothetical protein
MILNGFFICINLCLSSKERIVIKEVRKNSAKKNIWRAVRQRNLNNEN